MSSKRPRIDPVEEGDIQMTLVNLSSLHSWTPLANHLWQSKICVGIAWLLTVALRGNRAAVRYWIWFAASVKFLIPFSPFVALGGLLAWRTAPVTAQPQWSFAVDSVVQPFSASAPVAQIVAHHAALPIDTILVGIWLCGVAVGLIFWMRCWRTMRAVRRAATALPVGLPIPAMSSPSQIEPGVFGIFRPVLLLPAGIAECLTPAQLDAIVAHEMAHVRRRDNLTAAIHMLVETIFWFFPLVWWIRVQLIEERERACDEYVMRSGADAETYAEGIIEICKSYVASPAACISGISGSDLKKRIIHIVNRGYGESLTRSKKFALAIIGALAVLAPLAIGLAQAPAMRAQSSATQQQTAADANWEQAAGGKMEFEVASVRLNKGPTGPSNFPFGPDKDNAHIKTGGLFTGYYTLANYILFAYKILPTREQFQLLFGKLPPWVITDNYEIQARAAEPNPTPDQVRLMLQSLLKERFGLAAHYETQDTPVLVMSFIKSEKLGPKLQRHEDGPACSVIGKAPEAAAIELKETDIFPAQCGGIEGTPIKGGTMLLGGRNVTLEMMATSFEAGRLGKPIVVGTGLTGNYDFKLSWLPEAGAFGRASVPASEEDPLSAPQGPTFLEALKDQLGLKLVQRTSPMNVLVIDHIEEPTPN
jgi:bla regulator protein BlaR1